MPNILYPPSRPQSVGELLDWAFRIYRATLVKCLPFAVTAVIVGQLPSAYQLLTGRNLSMLAALQRRDTGFWVVYAAGVLLSLLVGGALLLRQYGLAGGRPAGGELRTSLNRLPTQLGVTVLVAAAVLAGWLLVAGLGQISRPLALSLGGVLLLLASYAFIRISCAWILVLVADAGVTASLTRSLSLTAGSFWRLTGIFTVAVIIFMVIYSVVGGVGGVVFAIISRGDVATTMTGATIMGVVAGALCAPFYPALALAVYGDLTVRKEGADLEQRISAPT